MNKKIIIFLCLLVLLINSPAIAKESETYRTIYKDLTTTGSRNSETADSLLETGNEAYKNEQSAGAIEHWRKVENDFHSTKAWPKAVYNTGIALKEMEKFDEAIEQFEKLLKSDVDDTESGSFVMEVYQNYRPKAQWEIAACLLAKEEYEEALKAYQLCQSKYPFKTWCGTCRAEYENEYALYQGLCLEYLGRYNLAVKSYFKPIMKPMSPSPIVHIRIVDLYQSTGQTEALAKILDEVDKYWKNKILREHDAEILNEPDFQEHMFTQVSRRLLEIRRMEERRDLTGLIELVKSNGDISDPEEYEARLRHWDAVEAANLLAKHPEESVELLNVSLKDDNNEKMIYYALGLCGTKEAVSILKSEAVKQKNIHWTIPVVYALSLAGDDGRKTLEELSKTAEGNLKFAIQQYKEDKLGDTEKEIKFPEIPKNIKLPGKLAEIDDEVAYWQSLPQKVNVDLSKQELTIKTFMTSMVIADINALSKCFADSNLAEKMSGGDLKSQRTSYEITCLKFTNVNTAEVDLNLNVDRKDHKILFILKKIDYQWFITSLKEESRLKTSK